MKKSSIFKRREINQLSDPTFAPFGNDDLNMLQYGSRLEVRLFYSEYQLGFHLSFLLRTQSGIHDPVACLFFSACRISSCQGSAFTCDLSQHHWHLNMLKLSSARQSNRSKRGPSELHGIPWTSSISLLLLSSAFYILSLGILMGQLMS